MIECIIRYRDFYASLNPGFENNTFFERKFSDEKSSKVCGDFKAIDDKCLLNNNCWKGELDYLQWEGIILQWIGKILLKKIIDRLEGLTEDELHADPPIQTPIGDNTLRGVITFICHHEAYHIGQISIARRHFGYEPMSYA